MIRLPAPPRFRHGWGLSAVIALTALIVAAMGLSADAGSSEPATPPIPLATSLQSAAGTWVTLPMGHLSQPLNTFWQLFFRATGTTSWSNKVQATATATNGGLVLATAAGQPFIAAVRPADLLRFSPLIATTDGGRSWSDGLLPRGLTASPDSLSTAPGGPTLALVDRGLGGRVLTSVGSLSTWRTLTTARRLASGNGGGTCGVRALTAVASVAGNAVVGASCSRPGVVGLFMARGSTWRLDALTLPQSPRGGRVQVLGLEATPSGLAALVQSIGKSGSTLFAAWTTDGTGWTVPAPLTLPVGQHLLSFGSTAAAGLFALTGGSSGAERTLEDIAPGAAWRRLPAPPPGTSTVAFDSTTPQTVDAFAVHDSSVTVWTLDGVRGSWARAQAINVAIKFGSSS
jgi:hypothetical protein